MLKRLFKPTSLKTLIKQNKFVTTKFNSYFTDTFTDEDKFTKDGVKYGVPVIGIAGNYAKQLFRHGYNTNQLGYFLEALRVIEKYYIRNKILPIHDEEFQAYLYNSGVPDDLTYDFLERLVKDENVKTIKDVVFLYEQLYLAHTKSQFGVITLAKPYNNLYNNLMSRAQQYAVAQLGEEGLTVEFEDFEVKPEILGGWLGKVGFRSMDRCSFAELAQAKAIAKNILADELPHNIL